MKIAVPVLGKKIEDRYLINPHFGRSKYFALVEIDSENVEIVENPVLDLSKGKGNLITKFFCRKNVKAVLAKEIGSGVFDKLESAGIGVYLIPQTLKFLDEAVKLFKNGKLKKISNNNK